MRLGSTFAANVKYSTGHASRSEPAESGSPLVESTVGGLADKVKRAFQKALGIASPRRPDGFSSAAGI
jgi:hypothetical protein